MPVSRIIVSLDYPTPAQSDAFVAKVTPGECALKVGSELFTAAGPDYVRRLATKGFRVFLDLKFHDIPNTVAQACKSAAGLGVWMLNVHASGGRAMMSAAANALAASSPRPILIAVTVLTSLDDAALRETGIDRTSEAHAENLARLTRQCGLDGVVCSAWEAAAIKAANGPQFLAVVPGIRLVEGDAHDQMRIATPEVARRAGADYLVIGRAITQAEDPHATLRGINHALGNLQ